MQIQGLELRELVRRLKEDEPNIYANFFQRIYAEDAQFHDWRFPLWDMGHQLTRFRKLYRSEATEISHDLAFACQYIGSSKEHNHPLFFVDRPLFDACAATGIPKGIRIADLHFPYEGFTFILPKGAFKTSEGEIAFITVAHDQVGTKRYQLPGFGGKPRTLTSESADEAIIIHTFFANNAHDFTIRTDDSLYNEKELPTFHELIVGETDTGQKVNTPVLFGGNEQELDRVTEKLCALVPSLLLAMECRPDLVERERRIKTLRRDRHTEVWQPNRIGKTYRVKVSGRAEPGDHASPRQHWRRGHVRLVPIEHGHKCTCGHSRAFHDQFCMDAGCSCIGFRLYYTQTRKHWIEPILIN